LSANPTFILQGPRSRAMAAEWVRKAPDGSTMILAKPKRTLGQNKLLHAICTEIAGQVEWSGKKRNVEAWKDILTAALLSARNELDVVPGINGGFVLLGLHTSDLNKEDCADLIELAYSFGASHGVVFAGDEKADAA
jgi:hypothetical protein